MFKPSNKMSKWTKDLCYVLAWGMRLVVLKETLSYYDMQIGTRLKLLYK